MVVSEQCSKLDYTEVILNGHTIEFTTSSNVFLQPESPRSLLAVVIPILLLYSQRAQGPSLLAVVIPILPGLYPELYT